MKKRALITGITGQDGSYLAEFLLEKGYEVYGIRRRTSILNTQRIDPIYNYHEYNSNFHILYGDMTDTSSIISIIEQIRPDEIYNLAAQSHVGVSFNQPEYTGYVDGLGTLRILEAVRILKLTDKTKIYQASTSELYGKVQEIPQKETTPFYPRSPYAVAKLYAYWISKNYREAYNIFVSNGILFNHESPRRGENFVTRKITLGLSKFIFDIDNKIYLGNLSAKRDWGHAKDYVSSMWMILQYDKADDWVIATGKTTEIREFCRKAFENIGLIIEFEGENLDEQGILSSIKYDILENKLKSIGVQDIFIEKIVNNLNNSIGLSVIEVDPKYFRPTEVDLLIGDSTKAQKLLGWKPKYTLEELIEEMMINDLKQSYVKYLENNFLKNNNGL